MPVSVRNRQKKLEKARKKRDALKANVRKREAQFQGASLLRLAQGAPFGPAWISAALDESDPEQPPALITVVVTRRVRGLLLTEIALVDRTCLGIKNALLWPLQAEADLLDRLDDVALGAGELRACDPLEAQSVVFHALDYARSLGFGPHEDFEIALFEPRPESLRETPLAKAPRPIFISGPSDDVPLILERLEEHAGADNYSFVVGNGDLDRLLGDFGDEDGDGDGDGDGDEDDGEVETTGESSEPWK